jgi:hypothetical protein
MEGEAQERVGAGPGGRLRPPAIPLHTRPYAIGRRSIALRSKSRPFMTLLQAFS